MRPARLILVFVMAVFLSGCAFLFGQTPDEYQSFRSVKEGQRFHDTKASYDFVFPDSYYYLERSGHKFLFIPKEAWKNVYGEYIVYVLPKNSLSRAYQNDLKKAFDLFARKSVGSGRYRQATVVKAQEQDVNGEKAVYREFFIPERIVKDIDEVMVPTSARGNVGIVFFHKDHVYWIFHADPVDDPVIKERKITPKVEPRTVKAFDHFLTIFSDDPSR